MIVIQKRGPGRFTARVDVVKKFGRYRAPLPSGVNLPSKADHAAAKAEGHKIKSGREILAEAGILHSHTATHRSKDAARDWARRIELEIKGGRCSICADKNAVVNTLGAVCDAFLASEDFTKGRRRARAAKTMETIRGALRALRAEWGDARDVRLITRPFLKRWGDGHAEWSGARKNQLVWALRRAVDYAMETGALDAVPFIGHRPWPAPEGRKRVLSPGDVAALRKVLPASLADPFELCVCLGFRKGEVQALRWEQVDLTVPGREHIDLFDDTKGRYSRRVPVHIFPHVAKLLRALPRGLPKALVFPDFKAPALKGPWWDALRKAGVEQKNSEGEIVWHTTRHTAITNMLASKELDPLMVAKITGHRSLMMQAKYEHLTSAQILDRLADVRLG